MIIRKVFILGFTKQKLVTIPKDSEIIEGDYVRIEKVSKNG